MPQPRGADSHLARKTEAEPSGKTASEVLAPIITYPAISAEMANEEVEFFHGTQSAGNFIAAVTALLKIHDLRERS
jgi:hypothetical protein